MSDKSLYLSLMESVLTGSVYRDPSVAKAYQDEERIRGGDWPLYSHTMIGQKRLHQLREACETVLREDIPGNFLECGVWRGGAAIMMKAALVANDCNDRDVILADSFNGLPAPDSPEDSTFKMSQDDLNFLKVSMAEVIDNFRSYGLFDSSIRLIPGWFSETLPKLNVPLSILRADGDLYKSTWDILINCYDLVSDGGFVIIDDYGAMIECRRAVDRFLEERKLKVDMQEIDWSGVYWRVRK